MFDRLYIVEKFRKLNIKSSGIGFMIVKKLVNSLKGIILVLSVLFEKIVFKFILFKILKKL